MEVYRISGHRLRGTPRLYGDRLCVSSRTTGDISVVDISDLERPRLLEHFSVPGNPGKVALHNGVLVIPNGYEGLWVEDIEIQIMFSRESGCRAGILPAKFQKHYLKTYRSSRQV